MFFFFFFFNTKFIINLVAFKRRQKFKGHEWREPIHYKIGKKRKGKLGIQEKRRQIRWQNDVFSLSTTLSSNNNIHSSSNSNSSSSSNNVSHRGGGNAFNIHPTIGGFRISSCYFYIKTTIIFCCCCCLLLLFSLLHHNYAKNCLQIACLTMSFSKAKRWKKENKEGINETWHWKRESFSDAKKKTGKNKC